ncbi:MAG TPA: hypothetical protein VEJ38_15940 [Candidatus Acidoferrales bacterium]|nr:hypothetical protein [Candidatus Acidoferrales bacterium]
MRRLLLILGCFASLACLAPNIAKAQSGGSASPATTSPDTSRSVDGIAARIEDDILTESELRELAAFQELVDGHAKPRADLIRELGDQWIVNGEAQAAKYPKPSQDDVDRAYALLVARFPSQESLGNRCAAVGLTESEIRRMLAKQLYLSRFLDYRFRPAAQVDQKQIESYYDGEFVPQMKSRGQPVPPLDEVEDTIREVLVQRAISDLATQWLDETRARLKIDVMLEGDRP